MANEDKKDFNDCNYSSTDVLQYISIIKNRLIFLLNEIEIPKLLTN